jgi:hypothetical protein
MFSKCLALAVVFGLAVMGCASKEGGGQTGDDQNVTSAPTAASAAAPQDPAPGTPERKAFMTAVHAKFDPMLGNQQVEYLVSFLKTKGGFTFMEAEIHPKTATNVDWSKTQFKDDVDLMDLNTDQKGVQHPRFSAIAKKNGSQYSDVDLVVAPTDVSFAGMDNPAVPKDIFPFTFPEN